MREWMINRITAVLFWPIDRMHDKYCSCGTGYGDKRVYAPQQR